MDRREIRLRNWIGLALFAGKTGIVARRYFVAAIRSRRCRRGGLASFSHARSRSFLLHLTPRFFSHPLISILFQRNGGPRLFLIHRSVLFVFSIHELCPHPLLAPSGLPFLHPSSRIISLLSRYVSVDPPWRFSSFFSLLLSFYLYLSISIFFYYTIIMALLSLILFSFPPHHCSLFSLFELSPLTHSNFWLSFFCLSYYLIVRYPLRCSVFLC